MYFLQNHSNLNLPVDLEILDLSPLAVSEGDHVLVTNENIVIVLDIAKYQVDETGVVFTVVTPPAHGTLVLDLLTNGKDYVFTLQDVNQNKVTSF